MKKIEFERIKSETVSWGGIKGSRYEFEGIKEKIKESEHIFLCFYHLFI